MCLLKITTRKLKKKSGFGWKVFRVKSKDRLGHLYANRRDILKEGVVYKKNALVMHYDLNYYAKTAAARKRSEYSGFHIFAQKKDALARMKYKMRDGNCYPVVRKVQFYGATCRGIEKAVYGRGHTEKVIIADRIKILPEGSTKKVRRKSAGRIDV